MSIIQEVYLCIKSHQYADAIQLLEQHLALRSEPIESYWYLGLAYLLSGQEAEAQTTWMLTLSALPVEKIEESTLQLVNILQAEAQQQLEQGDLENSWLIRQHIREIAPNHKLNLLELIKVAIDLNRFSDETYQEWEVSNILVASPEKQPDINLILEVLKKLLEVPLQKSIEFVQISSKLIESPHLLVDLIVPAAVKQAYTFQNSLFACELAEQALKLEPANPNVLFHLSCFYTQAAKHQMATEAAHEFFNNCQTLPWQILGSYLILRARFGSASWDGLQPFVERHKNFLKQLSPEIIAELQGQTLTSLIVSPYFLPYAQDNLEENRQLQNKAAELFQVTLVDQQQVLVSAPPKNITIRNQTQRLKIGYVAHTLKGHSVGWLSRWLFTHHNHKEFQTSIYFINQPIESQQYFAEKVDIAHSFGPEPQAVAKKIQEDQVDILVDLDSITLDITCQVIALKPAPVQVTWLGWDASGLPAVDYFIADPYVLPDNAQEHYRERIWRLPHTYVAVDGFEIGIPTLRRQNLGIPEDAIVYLSAQKGFKRHPDTVRLQLEILRNVPNSYLLIKGLADEAEIQKLFSVLATEIRIEPNRIKFLERDPDEFTHRANLTIADVVLDTYPYNGATTTLETLWMELPLVTRVGQQFAARNSYTFMMNAGVTEGIAWTAEEYVEWGVRLGLNKDLRQQVVWKLRQSKHKSPLWNAKQFTREMESAYHQMWQIYINEQQG